MEVELRVVLLIVGLIILFVVGLDLFRRRVANQAATKSAMLDPEINIVEQPFFDPVVDLEPLPAPQYVVRNQPQDTQMPLCQDEPADISDPEIELKPAPTNIISITLKARDRYGFKGSDLLKAAQSAHLYFGKNDIFYRYIDDAGAGEILFSMVKAVEPGYFYIETLADEYVPGVTLILLPDKIDNPHLAFDKLVRTAKQMAFSLNAELLDHQRQPLTLETIDLYNNQAKQK